MSRSCAIAFLHGYLGVLPRLYWSGLRRLHADLRARGHLVLMPQTYLTRPVEDRAEHVWRRVRSVSGGMPVILVGHSMGGLDARRIASHLDPEQRVTAVITMGTPHRGSALAEQVPTAKGFMAWVMRTFDRGGTADLTPARMALFNAVTPNRPDIFYASVNGARPSGEMPFRALAQTAADLERLRGPNDGLIDLASAAWGDPVIAVRADHYELAGLSLARADPASARPYDAPPNLRRLVDRAVSYAASV
ncbi:esterase/lipase family protein [Marinivivus vitaminiproducens]|uniref:esterase/lipase family protein n=1 Tax=Marinivivus vitaminiproducens TaxID=3035935 RepID=UPI0027A67A75|nr:alpha/beta fold hydrolase [Geminicoccaceae bacterium SCSIO 64248]